VYIWKEGGGGERLGKERGRGRERGMKFTDGWANGEKDVGGGGCMAGREEEGRGVDQPGLEWKSEKWWE